MNKKQIAGLVAAAFVFVFICSANLLVKNAAQEQSKKALAQSVLDSVESQVQLPSEPFVGVVKVDGTIMKTTSSSSLFPTEGYNHDKTLKLIDQLQESGNNRGILLYVNTPGGSVYETDELYQRLLKYKKDTGRPVWTYMANEACSGGYYVSMASDKIYANRNTWTGSIGVILSLSNYKGLMDKLGVDTILFTSGPNKSMGNPGVDVTNEQKTIFQGLVDESYEQFVGIVAQGRKMSVDTVKPIADGRIYTAQQALDLKLIDGIQNYEDTQAQMKKELGGEVTFFTPKSSEFNLNSLFSMAKSYTSTDADKIKELLESQESGVPMYYAVTGK
ncbi:signal peptide peptidase SppA [Caproiciproducens faecalis]|uniref:Signal peptide peptidase SppA n=1 Tax=Caproiciproducens faecalis TaxID=2820301 RepID=A0ABS7DNI1_9FIRM|nr:signal peptide peptidase SppA [Caproiciproducens faecalis]MBW7572646.1 signal peptide peptidase SppA [Caproiciproducens faecalis]